MMWVNPAKTPKIAQKLTQLAYETMMKGIEQAKVGNSTRDIAKAMQDYAESFNCSVVRDYCGHGIGRKFHDEPSILNFYKEPKKSSKKNQYREPDFVEIKEGMFFTVEPMVNAGGHKVRTQKDGWTIKTSDLSLSCQFEHTIGITANGPEIFTLSPKGLDKPLY